ncbi:hypothetical protein ACFQE1_01620 [Halobium palmae]|uniref:Transposase n=1 Tax=Halobium palmae TaxID=1776492 RepID=A0ABD5RV67_9EURY
MQDAVKYLIQEAEKHVSIKEVSMDSAFRKMELLKWPSPSTSSETTLTSGDR